MLLPITKCLITPPWNGVGGARDGCVKRKFVWFVWRLALHFRDSGRQGVMKALQSYAEHGEGSANVTKAWGGQAVATCKQLARKRFGGYISQWILAAFAASIPWFGVCCRFVGWHGRRFACGCCSSVFEKEED